MTVARKSSAVQHFLSPRTVLGQPILIKNISPSISPLSQKNQLNSELPASTSAHTFGESLKQKIAKSLRISRLRVF